MALFSKNFWIKVTQWEYWPFNVLYAPVAPYFIWQILKRRSFFFFTASNPSIDFGGMLGERKSEIFDLIADEYLPKTILLKPDIELHSFNKLLKQQKITYPFILKPDIGERGWMVKKIANQSDLSGYLQDIKVEFLLQEYIDLPLELGIFYYRYPGKNTGKVSSVVVKEMLFVEGNGQHTIMELIEQKPRARFQLESLLSTFEQSFLSQILPIGKRVELVSIGNHCKGTKFLDGKDWIDEKLTHAMDQLALNIPGFYFGRFDLRCESIEALRNLQSFKIMELNGAGAEPAHIYQPGFSLLKAYGVLFHHVKVLSKISSMNKKSGTPYWSTKKGLAKIKEIKLYNRQKD